MHATDLERMIAVADEFFEAKNDPDQILVNEGILEGLKRIHPVTLSEETDDDGPIAWMLVIPTTHMVMEQVIRKETGLPPAKRSKHELGNSQMMVFLAGGTAGPRN
jgi:hypothetical protein